MIEVVECPSDETLVALVEQAIAPGTLARIEDHVDSCPRCRATIGALAGGSTVAEGTAIGRYRLIEKLGAGGMGEVWLAHDPELDRQIALKLLGSTVAHSEDAHERLRREARAMAGLNHPNVLPIFDVVTIDDRAVIAMEYVPGGTLADAARDAASWRDALALCVQAGRGLAAAHAAGIVHRDFKPDNVLCGTDRVVVGDFGLASLDDRAGSPGTPLELTRSGVRVGTPRYMAPEQLRDGACDARSDQWSFGATAYEVIYGRPAFRGATLDAVTEAITHGDPPQPSDRRIPARLRRAISRTMQVDPAARFPSMDALLRELERHTPIARRRRVRTWIGSIAAVAVAALFAIAYPRVANRGADSLCELGDADVWSVPDANRVHLAFLSTRVPFAEATWRNVDRGMTDRAAEWTTTRHGACVAAKIRGEVSDAVLDRQMECFDRRRGALRALAGELATANAAVVQRAVLAVDTIPDIASCRDLTTTASVEAPTGIAQRTRVAAIRTRLDQARALRDAGEFQRAAPLLVALEREAGALGYRPLVADVAYEHGIVDGELGDTKAAKAELAASAWAAEASRSDELAAEARIALAGILAGKDAHVAEGQSQLHEAEAAVERVGRPPQLQLSWIVGRAKVEQIAGDYKSALADWHQAVGAARDLHRGPALIARLITAEGTAEEHLGHLAEAGHDYEQSLAMQKAALGPAHPDVATTLESLGIIAEEQDHPERGLELHQQALAIRRATFGSSHRAVAESLEEIALVHHQLGHHAESLAYHQQAVDMALATYGPRHPVTARYLAMRAVELRAVGRTDDALADQLKALEIKRAAFGDNHPSVASSRVNTGMLLLDLARPEEARTHFLAAVAIIRTALGPEHKQVGDTLAGACMASIQLGDTTAAIAYAKDALAIFDKLHAEPPAAETLICGATALLDRGNGVDALPMLERALKIQDGDPDRDLALGRYQLARALWLTGGDRARAHELAQAAQAGLADAGTFPRATKLRADVARWLASHSIR